MSAVVLLNNCFVGVMFQTLAVHFCVFVQLFHGEETEAVKGLLPLLSHSLCLPARRIANGSRLCQLLFHLWVPETSKHLFTTENIVS